jgi:diaminopimelate epimerase
VRPPLRFVKMSGAGNDFIVLDPSAWESIEGDRTVWIRDVCRRGVSVGADGVLVVEAGADGRVTVRFLNPDGGEAFCGNGSRCAARYAHERCSAPADMILRTAAGDVPAEIRGSRVRLTLPAPEDLGPRTLDVSGRPFEARLVSAGVPHLVLGVGDVAGYPLAEVAPSLRRHPTLGAQGANVDVIAVDGAGRIRVRTWERGVENETLSCGSGAVAAAFAARLGGAPSSVEVIPRSGIPLSVELPGEPDRPRLARLEGDARFVYDGALLPDGRTGTAWSP